MFTQLIKPVLNKVHRCAVEEVKHSRQKELRIIDTLGPLMDSHRFVVNQQLITQDWQSTDTYPGEVALKYQLFYQLTHITRERGSLLQDDRLDAVAIAAAYWVQSMAQDMEKSAAGSRQKLIDAEIESWKKQIWGKRYKERPRVWAERV
jgi:hypothetical protein